jgi:hypothetical protein
MFPGSFYEKALFRPFVFKTLPGSYRFATCGHEVAMQLEVVRLEWWLIRFLLPCRGFLTPTGQAFSFSFILAYDGSFVKNKMNHGVVGREGSWPLTLSHPYLPCLFSFACVFCEI